MQPYKRMRLESEWTICPPEILWIIFKYLDTKALTRCMLVNRKWKHIAENVAQQYNIWEKIVKSEMSNKGAALIRKSKLNWRSIYKNSLLWHQVKSAHVVHLNTYEALGVKKIKIYNGNLIVIDGLRATYYDINTFRRVSQWQCVDLDENDNMLAILTQEDYDRKQLNLCVKTNVDKLDAPRYIKSLRYYMNDIIMFKLENNSCYIVLKGNIMRVVTSKEMEYSNEFLGRCYTSRYDPIIDIHIWNDAGFLISKWGTIWSFSSVTAGLQKAYKLEAPDNVSEYNWVMFDKFSSVIPVNRNSNERVTMQYDERVKAMMLQCADLTSAISHDDVLFLGYRDGTVEIRLPMKNIRNIEPERYFNIQEFCNGDEDCAVVALNVYEIENSHILFVSTNAHVYQFQLTYPEHVLCCI